LSSRADARDLCAARRGDSSPWAWNDTPSSSRADARDPGVASGGDSSPAARNDNWGLRLGMTIAALRLGMTKGDGCERQAVGRVAKIRNARSSSLAPSRRPRAGRGSVSWHLASSDAAHAPHRSGAHGSGLSTGSLLRATSCRARARLASLGRARQRSFDWRPLARHFVSRAGAPRFARARTAAVFRLAASCAPLRVARGRALLRSGAHGRGRKTPPVLFAACARRLNGVGDRATGGRIVTACTRLRPADIPRARQRY